MRALAGCLALSLAFLYRDDALAIPVTAKKPVECSAKIGEQLGEELRKQFPSWHIPSLAELDNETVEYDRSHSGDGCYVVAKGDFLGQGRKSTALILTSPDGDTRLLVTSKTKSGWRFDELPSWGLGVSSIYVEVGRPGVYVRTQSLDTPLQPNGELAKITTKNEVLISGKIESSGIAYVYRKSRWNYVWISD